VSKKKASNPIERTVVAPPVLFTSIRSAKTSEFLTSVLILSESSGCIKRQSAFMNPAIGVPVSAKNVGFLSAVDAGDLEA
jgi:hypothetical protein